MMAFRSFLVGAVAATGLSATAALSVTVGAVRTGEPWSTVTVDYTLGGVDADREYKVAFDVTANGVMRGVTNAAAKLTNGTASKIIDTVALFGSASADPKAKVRVSLIAVNPLGGVQLWENGPYWAECNVGAAKPEGYGYYFWWGDTVGYARSEGTGDDPYYSGVTWVSSMGTRMSSSPFSDSSCPTYYKDNSTLQSQGYIDSTGNLVAKYDAATALLGDPWRMPTSEEIQTLVDNCTTTWTTRNGVYGRLVTGKGEYASKSIFLPAAGHGVDSELFFSGYFGYYQSSTPEDISEFAWYLFCEDDEFCRESDYRYVGRSVRPLRGKDVGAGTVETVVVSSAADFALSATVAPSVTVGDVRTGVPSGTITVNYTLGGLDADLDYKVAFDVTANGVTRGVTNAAAKLMDGAASKVIDTAVLFGSASADPKAKVRVSLITVKPQLGGVQLWENGPYWAECNVGASKPEEYGYYFWWGDTVGYKRNASNTGWVSVKNGTSFWFSIDNCPIYDKSYPTLQSQGYIDSTGNLVAKYDAATAHLGAPWQMPTSEEIQALVNNCTTTWTTRNGVYGRLVTGKGMYASKSIFLPAAGYGVGSTLNGPGSNGDYWSSTPDSPWDSKSDLNWDGWCGAGELRFFSDYFFGRFGDCCFYGSSVRPLRGKDVGSDTVETVVVSSAADFALSAPSAPSVTAITAQQRYPWNGMVDIAVTFEGASNDVAEAECVFSATNSATQEALLMAHVMEAGTISRSGTTWTRRFVWDATADMGKMKIDNVVLTVERVVPDEKLGGVQLWENGPYWAECNVGASKPEEYGYYFGWGDMVGYTCEGGMWTSDWGGYYSGVTWVSSSGTRMSSSPFSPSCCPTINRSDSELQSAGYIDSTGNLVAKYDVATAHFGAPWRMPTSDELQALVDNCTTTWTTRNGVSGRLVTGKGTFASKSIFLPAAGYGVEGDDSYLYYLGSQGNYWSSTPDSDSTWQAWYLSFSAGYFDMISFEGRCFGMSVRPLRGSRIAGVASTSLALDTRTGVRPMVEQVTLRYSAQWADGESVRILQNGVVLASKTDSGNMVWSAPYGGIWTLIHQTLDVGGEVVDEQTARFAAPPTAVQAAFDGVGEVLFADGTWQVTVTNDAVATIELPDNLGPITIDLNGHALVGSDGAEGNSAQPGADGSPAILVTHADGDGAATQIGVVDSCPGEASGVFGGRGGVGAPPGNGGAAIQVASDVCDGVRVDVGVDVKIGGGAGGTDASGTGSGGRGGAGVDGNVGTNDGSIVGGVGGSSAGGRAGAGGMAVSGNLGVNNGTVVGGSGGASENGSAGAGGIAVGGEIGENAGGVEDGKDGEDGVDVGPLWPVDGDFSAVAAHVYDGFLADADNRLVGLVQVKTAKQTVKKMTDKVTKVVTEVTNITVTATVTDANGKKWSYSKGAATVEGEVTGLVCTAKGCPVSAFGVTLGMNGLVGEWGDYAIFGARNGLGVKVDAMMGMLEAYRGKWSVTLGTDVPLRLQLDIQTKGSVKIAGNWENGAKVSASAQLVMGDGFAYVPVVLKATKTTSAVNALFRIAADGETVLIAAADPMRSEGELYPLMAGGRTVAVLEAVEYLPSEVSKGGAAFLSRVAVDELAYPAKFAAKRLPAGLKIDAATGVIAGTPTKPGFYTATVTVTSGADSKVKKDVVLELEVANYTDGLVPVEDAYGPYYVGVAVNEPVDAAADCAVSGLPGGLKWTAKDVVDAKTKKVTTVANSVYGIPTKAVTNTVYFKKSVKENGKTVAHQASATFRVEGLKPWAVGTFDGGSAEGQVQLTVSNVGKISGKWLSAGVTWTLSATAFDAYDAEREVYYATLVAKSGKDATKIEIELTEEGVVAFDGREGASRVAVWSARRNAWKEEPLKTLAVQLKGRKARVGESENIELVVGAGGAVTAKGTFYGLDGRPYSASCAAALIPVAGSSTEFAVYIYYPPKSGKFDGWAARVVVSF